MCDYSLMAIPNRLAVSGEELVVHNLRKGGWAGVTLRSSKKTRVPQGPASRVLAEAEGVF